MLQKNTKVIALGGGVFFCVSIVIFSLFLFAILKQQEELATETVERSAIQSRQESLVSLRQVLTATKEARESLLKRVLKEEDVIDFLSLIETLGKEQSAKLTTHSITVQPIDKTFESLVIRVSVEGSYSSVKQVLMLLERMPYQTTISAIQIVKGENIGWKGDFEVRVTKYKAI